MTPAAKQVFCTQEHIKTPVHATHPCLLLSGSAAVDVWLCCYCRLQCRATAQLYEQCGGLSCQFKGVCADSNWAACTNGHSCVRKSEFYW